MSFQKFTPRVRQYEGANPGVPAQPYGRAAPREVRTQPIPKDVPVRIESYRRWVSTLACCACGIEGYSQAAHPNFGRGLGQKASDLEVFPLCAVRPGHMGCHQMHDLLIDMTLTIRRGLEREYIRKTQALARAEGRKEIE